MTVPRNARKVARKFRGQANAASLHPAQSQRGSKLDLVLDQLTRPGGASRAERVAATGWQPHSVRGALAGALKKKGHAIISEKLDGERRYRVGAGQ